MRSEFRTFLLVDEAKQPITVDKMMERLERAVERGFDLDQFLAAPEGAREAGRAYLSARRSASTVFAYNNDVKVLSALLRWKEWRHMVRFKCLREPRPQLRALKDDEIWTLLGYRCESGEAELMHRALLLVALKTGMRASEVAAMNASDIDVANARIYVRKPAKGGVRRWLPVEKWVLSKKRPIGAWLAARPVPAKDPDALWTTTHKSGNGGYVPGASPARRVSSEYLRNCLYRIGHATGVHVTFNICRHTRGTELRKRGWDLLYIRTYLGHASVKSTEVYAEVGEEDVDEIMRKKPGKDFFKDIGE